MGTLFKIARFGDNFNTIIYVITRLIIGHRLLLRLGTIYYIRGSANCSKLHMKWFIEFMKYITNIILFFCENAIYGIV